MGCRASLATSNSGSGTIRFSRCEYCKLLLYSWKRSFNLPPSFCLVSMHNVVHLEGKEHLVFWRTTLLHSYVLWKEWWCLWFFGLIEVIMGNHICLFLYFNEFHANVCVQGYVRYDFYVNVVFTCTYKMKVWELKLNAINMWLGPLTVYEEIIGDCMVPYFPK